MAEFQRRALRINGIDTLVLEAGSGPTVVFLHGAGTVTGFDFAHAWAKHFRVLIPYHPGFGPSADDPEITEIHDYVLHYLDLFEELGLSRIRLVGQSMGGFIATKFAIEHGESIDRLALVCPIGIPVPTEHATVDFLATPPAELPQLLAHDPHTVIKHLPQGQPTPAFLAERAKEAATAGRLLGNGMFDRKLPRYVHRLKMPTLLVWGTKDRLAPAAQHQTWLRLLPRAKVRLFDDAGHLVLEEAPAAVTAIGEFLGPP